MSNRPAIVQIDEHTTDEETTVTILLSWQDEHFFGTASGSPEESSRARLVGEATLRAVEEVAERRISLQLEAVATTELGETQIAMAQVLMDGVPVPLVGSALLTEHDATAATVRAVLDAINRRLEQVL
jgi:hypothetical protein